MDVYRAISHELYHYGTHWIKGACYRQKPTTIGTCQVQTTSDGITITDPKMSHAQATGLVYSVLSNYPTNEYTIRMNKRKADDLYYATIVNTRTRREELSIRIKC